MTRTITAAELTRGTIVLTEDGERWFAAFDLFQEQGVDHDETAVWTAVPDQDRGVARMLTFPMTEVLTVRA